MDGDDIPVRDSEGQFNSKGMLVIILSAVPFMFNIAISSYLFKYLLFQSFMAFYFRFIQNCYNNQFSKIPTFYFFMHACMMQNIGTLNGRRQTLESSCDIQSHFF